MIDFTMSGLNATLIVGLALLLEGLCLLILMHPIKRRKHFAMRDYILLGFAIAVTLSGAITFIIGLCKTVPMLR